LAEYRRHEQLEPLAVTVKRRRAHDAQARDGQALSLPRCRTRAGRIQVHINNEGVGEDATPSNTGIWDIKMAATGTLFKTKTGELSIHATGIRLVTKSSRPARQVSRHGRPGSRRQRYVDLIGRGRAPAVHRPQAVSGSGTSWWPTIWKLKRPCCTFIRW
jgi:lysyl-tRNA synthetase class 2